MGLKAVRLGGIFAIGLLAAACTGAVSNNDGTAASGTIDTQVQPAQRFPLDEYLSLVMGTDLSPAEQLQQAQDERVREVELIAQCMHDAGFEYDPYNLPGGGTTRVYFTPDSGFDLNNREWVARFGYGVVLAEELGTRITTSGANQPETVEHNLSEAERAAFYRALSGPPCEEWGVVEHFGQGVTGCSLPDGWSLRDMWANGMGCMGQARVEIWDTTPSGLLRENEFAPLFDAIAAMRAGLREQVTPWETEWAACMADAGYPGFERRIDPNRSWASLPQIQIETIRDRIDRESLVNPTIENNAELAALLEREISTALIDLDCRESVNFESQENERRITAETQFINDHRATLKALRAAAEQRK